MDNPATLEQELQSLLKQGGQVMSQMEAIKRVTAQQAGRPISPAVNMRNQRRQLHAESKRIYGRMQAIQEIQRREQRRGSQANPVASADHDNSDGLPQHADASVGISSQASNTVQEPAEPEEPSGRRKRRRIDGGRSPTARNTLVHGDEGVPAPAAVEAAFVQSSAVPPPAVPATVTQRRAPSSVNTEAPNSNNAPAGQGRNQQAQLCARNRRFIQSLAEGQLAVDDPLYWTIVREGRYLVELHCPDSMCHANCRKSGTQRQNGESSPVIGFFKGTKGLKRHVTSTHKWQGWAGISEVEVVRLGHKRRLSDDEIDAVFHRRHAQFQVEACLPYKDY